MIGPDKWVLEDRDHLVPLDKWQRTVNIMAKVFAAPAGFIVQHTAAGYQVVIASQQVENPYPAGSTIPLDTNIFCKKVVATLNSLYVRQALDDPFWNDNPEVANDGFCSYLGLPIFWPNNEPFGTICVMDFKHTDYGEDFVALMSELRDLLQADLALLDQYQQIRSLAITDELTGLLNRRGFNLVAGQRLKLCRRANPGLGLLFFDLDRLKEINDIQGHNAGDRALASLAAAIKSTIRESDVAARIGGDEFVLVATAKNRAELEEVARRIAASYDTPDARVSSGGLIIDDWSKPLDHWISMADKAMYRHKHQRR